MLPLTSPGIAPKTRYQWTLTEELEMNRYIRTFASLSALLFLIVSATPSAMAQEKFSGTHSTAQLSNNDAEPGCD